MGGGDVQYRIDPSGEIQSFDQAVCVPADDGYLYEARILLDMVKPAPGILYSFEAGFADAQDGVVSKHFKMVRRYKQFLSGDRALGRYHNFRRQLPYRKEEIP